MKILVCDDEQKYCYIVKHLIYEILGEFSESVVYTIDSGELLIEYCESSVPDILFLDIELGKSNGIELAKTIRNKFPNLIIVYISNYPEYVFSSFETEPLNFLTKPINKSSFELALNHVMNKYYQLHSSIPIKWQNDSVNIEIKDICFVEGYNRHLTFHLLNGDIYEIVGKITEYYNKLKNYGFVKSHQGYIVNMYHIKEFNENEIKMKNGETVLLSVRNRLKVKEAYYDFITRR